MKTSLYSILGLSVALLCGFSKNGHLQIARADSDQSDTTATAPNNTDFVLISSVKIKPDQVVAFKNTLMPYAALTRMEDGNAAYLANQSADDPTEFAMYEHWKSDEARAAHLAAPYTVQFFKQVTPMFEPGYPVRKKFFELR